MLINFELLISIVAGGVRDWLFEFAITGVYDARDDALMNMTLAPEYVTKVMEARSN